MDDEIKQALIDLIKGPKSYSVDGESITAQSANDVLALLKKLEESEKGNKLKKRLGLFAVRTQEAAR